jgi:hypothetical protein
VNQAYLRGWKKLNYFSTVKRSSLFLKILNYGSEKFYDIARRRYFCDNISPEVNTYTLEASLYGYKVSNSDDVVAYTDDMYCRKVLRHRQQDKLTH